MQLIVTKIHLILSLLDYLQLTLTAGDNTKSKHASTAELLVFDDSLKLSAQKNIWKKVPEFVFFKNNLSNFTV
jgi:hypothetical protein